MSRDDKMQVDASAAELAACREVLAVFGRIAPCGEPLAALQREDGTSTGPKFSGVYRLARGKRTAQVTAEDITRAAASAEDSKATLEGCRKALLPFARLPVDPREDPEAVLYRFPAGDGKTVAVTNAMIERARELTGLL